MKLVITRNQSTGIYVEDMDVRVKNSALNDSISDSDEAKSSSESNDDESSIVTSKNIDHSKSIENRHNTQSPTKEHDSESVANQSNISQNKQFQLLGETHIGFVKILENEVKNFDLIHEVIMTIGTLSSQTNGNDTLVGKSITNKCYNYIKEYKLWFFGRHIGDIEVGIEISNLPFIKQMGLGVLTGSGISIASTPFGDDQNTGLGGSKKHLPQEMVDLIDCYESMRKRDSLKDGNKKVTYSKIEKQVDKSIKILNKSKKSSMVSAEYKYIRSGIKAQEVLVTMGTHCLSFVEFTEMNFRNSYYEILYLILHRGELDLNQIGFGNLSPKLLSDKRLMSEKEKVAVKYQHLIYEGLRFSIEKLTRKAIDFYKKDFVTFNIAIAYFKVPEFREKFLHAIVTDPSKSFVELKNPLHLRQDEEVKKTTIEHFFNWDDKFYKWIPESDLKSKNMKILSNILTMNKWEEKIAKRGVALFLIISKWAEYVKTTVVNKIEVWTSIPGYNTIVRVILSEMKERPLAEYPDALVECTCSMLGNERILKDMIHIIFNKTNIHVPQQVSK